MKEQKADRLVHEMARRHPGLLDPKVMEMPEPDAERIARRINARQQEDEMDAAEGVLDELFEIVETTDKERLVRLKIALAALHPNAACDEMARQLLVVLQDAVDEGL